MSQPATPAQVEAMLELVTDRWKQRVRERLLERRAGEVNGLRAHVGPDGTCSLTLDGTDGEPPLELRAGR